MAGIRSRISTLFKTKMNTPLAAVENPNETFDLSYGQQVEQPPMMGLNSDTPPPALLSEQMESPELIVRVQGSGQYRLMQPEIEALDGLDHRLSVAVHAHDEQQVHAVLGQMITLVQRRGTSVGPDELVTSTTILPPDTVDIEDVQALLHDDSTIWTGEPTPVPVDAR